MSNIDNLNNNESSNQSTKTSKFIENTKKAVRDTLMKTWIGISSMMPTATTTTPSVVPVSVNTITATAPIASTAVKTIWLWTAALLFSSFDKEHKSIEINNIKPVDILPIIWQIEVWDKRAYEHIEHLRVAEATRIRDMMREYGAGNHSPEEYQQLMMRLNTGMRWETPLWYNNYEIIWDGEWDQTDDNHAHTERHTLNTLINHANFKIVIDTDKKSRQWNLAEYIQYHPNTINIFWCSAYPDTSNKEAYESHLLKKDILDLCNSKNFIIFAAGTNIERSEWQLKNKIYNGEYEADEYGQYSLASLSNSDKNTQPNSHLLVTIATNKKWNVDQTNETYESSKFPVWFHNKVLFSGRTFPHHSTYSWKIEAESWSYTTSHTNYVNVALTDLCFQMFAEVKDVDELLSMIRSTSLTDYIKLDWETQALQLINPAWFFQKYLMPTALPTNLKTDETIDLEKGYYHGVIYQIPGAQVSINGQWIDFSDETRDIILTQNPMTLKWRLNGNLLNKYNCKPGDIVNGQIIVVDDKWNGLNITKDFSINVDNANGINNITTTPDTTATRYSIDGRRLTTKPTKPGVYIMDGQKIIIK